MQAKSGNILLVDDDPVVRMLVSEYLQALGYQIEEASGGVEALLKLRNNLPALLLLDLQMPDMSGIEVLKTLMQSRRRNLPVILLSANSDIKEIIEREGVSADFYLQKPFDMEAVRKAVDCCMNRPATDR